MVPPFEKVTKQKAGNNLFHVRFTLLKHFVFVICRHLTTLKWLKVLKLSKICLKMTKAMTPKTTDQNIWFLNDRIRFNLHCEPGHEKMCLMLYANNKGADQPAHPRSLISAFVVRCLDSIISLDSIVEISRL